MDGLFEAILSNPFLILLILGGIFSLFGGKTDKAHQENKQSSNRPTQTTQSYRRTDPIRNTQVNDHKTTNINTMSIEEHREEQIERLKDQLHNNDRYETLPSDDKNTLSEPKAIHHHEKSYQFNQFKKDMKRNLTKQGLVDSIVMAEVLGAPRARKPYRSIIYERKNLSK